MIEKLRATVKAIGNRFRRCRARRRFGRRLSLRAARRHSQARVSGILQVSRQRRKRFLGASREKSGSQPLISERSLSEQSLSEREIAEQGIFERLMPRRSISERSIESMSGRSVSEIHWPSRSSGASRSAIAPEPSWIEPETSVQNSLARLEAQADLINRLSADLETAMFEFKAIANEVNRNWRTTGSSEALADIKQGLDPAKVCEYTAAVVPYIRQREDRSFVLTVRSVDLFKAERDATLMAQALRQWAEKKTILR